MGGKGLRGRLFSSTEIQGEDRLPRQLNGKEPACNAEDHSLIPGLGRSAGEGTG